MMEPSGAPLPEIRTLRPAGGRVVHVVAHHDWLRSRGYLDPEGPRPSEARQVFHESPRRENAVREDGPRGERLFDKRALRLTRWKRLRALLRGRGGRSPVMQEWRALRRAAAHGVRVPEPWAAGERWRGGAPRSAWLLTRELPGRDLEALAPELAAWPRRRRLALVDAAAEAVARLHLAGISFPALYAKHLVVEVADGNPRVGFLDLAATRLHRGLPRWRLRVRDLGTLAGSTPRWALPLTLRRRFLGRYLAATGEARLPATAWPQLVEAARRVLLHRRERPCAALVPEGFALVAEGGTSPATTETPGALEALLDRLCDAGIAVDATLADRLVLVDGALRLAPGTPVERPRTMTVRELPRMIDGLRALADRLAPDPGIRALLANHLELEAEDRLLLRRRRGILGA